MTGILVGDTGREPIAMEPEVGVRSCKPSSNEDCPQMVRGWDEARKAPGAAGLGGRRDSSRYVCAESQGSLSFGDPVSLSVPELYSSADGTSRRGGGEGEPVSSNCDLYFTCSVQKSKLPNTQGSRMENPLGFRHQPHLHSLTDLSVLMENVFNRHFSQGLH